MFSYQADATLCSPTRWMSLARGFEEEVLLDLRKQWAALLADRADAMVVDEGQPFLLRGLAQWLTVFGDPDGC